MSPEPTSLSEVRTTAWRTLLKDRRVAPLVWRPSSRLLKASGVDNRYFIEERPDAVELRIRSLVYLSSAIGTGVILHRGRYSDLAAAQHVAWEWERRVARVVLEQVDKPASPVI